MILVTENENTLTQSAVYTFLIPVWHPFRNHQTPHAQHDIPDKRNENPRGIQYCYSDMRLKIRMGVNRIDTSRMNLDIKKHLLVWRKERRLSSTIHPIERSHPNLYVRLKYPHIQGEQTGEILLHNSFTITLQCHKDPVDAASAEVIQKQTRWRLTNVWALLKWGTLVVDANGQIILTGEQCEEANWSGSLQKLTPFKLLYDLIFSPICEIPHWLESPTISTELLNEKVAKAFCSILCNVPTTFAVLHDHLVYEQNYKKITDS